jgi:polar amino acid transport system substrate-binding protein
MPIPFLRCIAAVLLAAGAGAQAGSQSLAGPGSPPAAQLVSRPATPSGCSRPIVVPASPTGYSVIVRGDQVSGVFPDALRELGARHGCSFSFPVVPRARAGYMFLDSGEADLLLPASRSAERDAVADYVPMMKLRMALVSTRRHPVAADSVRQLVEGGAWRGVAVRGHVFGDQYNALMRGLEQRGRITYVSAPVLVARMLKAGRADFTVVAPPIFLASLSEDRELDGFAGEVRFTGLDGLPPTDSGVYVSRSRLAARDRAVLHQLLRQAAHGVLWKWYRHYYPPEMAAYAIPSR